MFREKRTLNMIIPDGSVSDGVKGHRSVTEDFGGQHVADVATTRGVGHIILGGELVSTEPGHTEAGQYPSTSRGLADLTGIITGGQDPALESELANLERGDVLPPDRYTVRSGSGHVGYVYDRRDPARVAEAENKVIS